MAEVKVPELAESITEGTIAEWLKQPGDYVEKGENILELETDKVNVEVISEESGTITELKAEEGDTVEVGQVIAIVGEGGSGDSSGSSEDSKSEKEDSGSEKKEETQTEGKKEDDSSLTSPSTAAGESSSSSGDDRIVASPSARRLAREKGLDLSDINASDPQGRVRSQDVANHSERPEPKQEEKKEAPKQQSDSPEKPVLREKMSRRRKTIAKRLHEVSQNTAMLTTFNEIDMTNVMELRKRKKEQFQERNDGTRLGFMSFFTKAAVAGLRKYPAVNAEIDGDDMIYKQFYDIGIAVSTDEGLLVPIVRNSDRKTFADIEANIAELAKKAQDKKLGLDDMSGGSFTITNGGVFGSLMSTPIINGTQAAILGMHTIQKRPIAMPDGSIEVRPMMYIALSYDHRIIDGKESVGFLKTIKELIENPEDLLLEG